MLRQKFITLLASDPLSITFKKSHLEKNVLNHSYNAVKILFLCRRIVNCDVTVFVVSSQLIVMSYNNGISQSVIEANINLDLCLSACK